MTGVMLSGIKHSNWWKAHMATTEGSSFWGNETICYQTSIITELYHLRKAN